VSRMFLVLALALAVGLATAASPYASSSPDGLERVAAEKRFLDRGESHDAPLSDYAFPGVDDPRVATGLAGFAGTLGVFAAGYGLALIIRRRRGWTAA
jgi:PDGLE domain